MFYTYMASGDTKDCTNCQFNKDKKVNLTVPCHSPAWFALWCSRMLHIMSESETEKGYVKSNAYDAIIT